MFNYNEKFYDSIKEMKADEKIIIPMLIEWISPRSIVDFGCGEGLWLAEARRIDPNIEIDGFDGDYVNRDRLAIPKDSFHPTDLRRKVTISEKYDLAISTEVAEHIEEGYADIFVDSLADASDNIFFTAALPEQGGTNHVNERWQSYWIEKFIERGYYLDLSVRNYFWGIEELSSWRRQNIMFFSRTEGMIAPFKEIYDVVHPSERLFLVKRERDAIFEQMLHYILYPEIYIGLDRALAGLIALNKRIAIYPYGINGKLCEILMIHKYKIKPYLLIDNYLSLKDERVIPACKIPEINEDFVIIETSGNNEKHTEVMRGIRDYAEGHDVYSVFAIQV